MTDREITETEAEYAQRIRDMDNEGLLDYLILRAWGAVESGTNIDDALRAEVVRRMTK